MQITNSVVCGASKGCIHVHKAKKKNSCVSGSPTDPKISGPTLDFFFSKKKKKNQKKNFFFFFFF